MYSLSPGNYAESFVQNATSIADISANIYELDRIRQDINTKLGSLITNRDNTNTAVQQYIQSRNSADLTGIYTPEEQDILLHEKDKTTKDVVLEDTNQILLQQNNMYLIGSIATATLLIAAIMIGSD